MNIVRNITKVWRNRKKIFEGFRNYIRRKRHVEEIAKKRMEICIHCKYGYYGGECLVPSNSPCCGSCGCILKVKVRSLTSRCGAEENGLEPLWIEEEEI